MKKTIVCMFFICCCTCLKAQDPTLAETHDYLKLKIVNSRVWYSKYSEITTTGCEEKLEYYIMPKSVTMFNGYPNLYFNSECNGQVCYLRVQLRKVQSVEVVDGAVKLSSSEKFIEPGCKTGPQSAKTIETDTNTFLKFYNVDNPEKLAKAFRHYFKLLDIKLLEDKF